MKLLSNKIGLPLKCLCIDRGGEFTLSKFNGFCKENDIQRPLTVVYTSQQNGVVERKKKL